MAENRAWRAREALEILDEIHEALTRLAKACQGADSLLVTTKLNSLDLNIQLLQAYLAEAESF